MNNTYKVLNCLIKEMIDNKDLSSGKVYGYELNSTGIPEITITLGTGITISDNNQDAFNLLHATQPIEINYVNSRHVVIRRYLTQEQVNDIIHNRNGNFLNLLIDEMVLTLRNTLGFDPSKKHTGVYGTFEFPENTFIRETGNLEKPFEIRLYSNCKEVLYK